MLRALTLLALALVLTSAHAVAAPTLNSRPPDFALKTVKGETVRLSNVIGQDRLLIAFRPDQAGLKAVQTQAAAYRDRDLRLLVIVPPGSPLLREQWNAPITLLVDPAGKTSVAYGASTARSFLVGKDGGIKGVYGGLPEAQELFATIDAMPMRQQEQRERGR